MHHTISSQVCVCVCVWGGVSRKQGPNSTHERTEMYSLIVFDGATWWTPVGGDSTGSGIYSVIRQRACLGCGEDEDGGTRANL